MGLTLSRVRRGEKGLSSDLVGIRILWPLELDLHRSYEKLGSRGGIVSPKKDMLESNC